MGLRLPGAHGKHGTSWLCDGSGPAPRGSPASAISTCRHPLPPPLRSARSASLVAQAHPELPAPGSRGFFKESACQAQSCGGCGAAHSRSSTDGHLGCFRLWAAMGSAATDVVHGIAVDAPPEVGVWTPGGDAAFPLRKVRRRIVCVPAGSGSVGDPTSFILARTCF